jgi:hypothetical protein
MADGLDAAAYQAAQSTQQARMDIAAERTAQAQATNHSLEADGQRLAITQTAQEMQATAFAGTATAWIGTTEANAYLANLEANQQAAATAIEREQRDAEVDMGIKNAAWILALLVGYVAVGVTALLALTLIVERYHRARWRYSGTPLAALQPANVIDLPASANQDVIELLEKSIAVNSAESNFIPRHDKLDMSGERRKRIVSNLKVFGCAATTPGESTMLVNGWKLGTLLDAMRRGEIGVR